jgi:ADP-ribose pyrophosphatase YjhB (NUDIX family)
LKDGDPPRLVCDTCGFIFYLDPKLAVGTVIVDDRGRIVLVRRAIEPGYGKWVFPGGYVDRGEEVEHAAIREALEETGLDVRLDRLMDIYSYTGRTPVIIVYAATLLGGVLACDDEGLEAKFFDPADIPWDALAFRSTHEALLKFLA